MINRPLGNTGIDVSEIGFGSWAIGGVSYRDGLPFGWAGADEKVSLAAVRRAWEVGMNFFDTADTYGRGKSEVLIGLGLYEHREKAVIASKVGRSMAAPGENFTEPYIRGSIDSSLSRLERNKLDVYLLHGPTMETMDDRLFDLMRELKEKGKFSSWGVSVFTAEEALKAIEGGAEVIELIYSLLQRNVGDAVFPVAEEKKVGIIVREAFASGWLTGKYNKDTVFPANDHRSKKFPPEKSREIAAKVEEFGKLIEGENMAEMALRFVLSDNRVSSVIPGCKSPEQVEANITASGKSLSADLKEKMLRIFS